MHEANTIVVEFSNGVYRVATYPEGDFSLIQDRKGNTETPDVFYWSETGGVSAGYPPESYAVYQDRYLDGIFDNIATSAVLPGLSGSDCMTLTIRQILQDTESFLGNPVQRILFLVPFNTPYFHLALLKTACKKNHVICRCNLRTYGAIIETLCRDQCRAHPLKNFSVIGAYWDNNTLELAVGEIDALNKEDIVIDILTVFDLQIPFRPSSASQRVQEIENLVLEKIQKQYPNLLMMNRSRAIRQAIFSSIEHIQNGNLSISYSDIYPGWINGESISIAVDEFQLLHKHADVMSPIYEKRLLRMGLEDTRLPILVFGEQASTNLLVRKAIASQWKSSAKTLTPLIEEDPLYALHGAAMYTRSLNRICTEGSILLLALHWKEFGIFHHGEFISVIKPENWPVLRPVFRAKPVHAEQKEVRFLLAERVGLHVSIFGYVTVDCQKYPDILLILEGDVELFLNAAVGNHRAYLEREYQNIIYCSLDETAEEDFLPYDYEITEMIDTST